MAELKSGIKLLENENLVMEIEAELWATSSNPIERFFAAIVKFFAMIFGYRKKGFWVITDKRVVEVSVEILCWCIAAGREIKYVLPNSVKGIGYTRAATCGCFCPAYHLYYESFTQRSAIMLKGVNEDGAAKAAAAFYAAIAKAN